MDSTGTSGVFARDYAELDRAVQVGVAGGRVISVSFPATVPDDATEDHELLDRIEAYLRGEPDAFDDVVVGLTVPTDRRGVLEPLRSVPYGEEVSVSRLTRLAGLDADDPKDLELVTAALNENPVPLLLPDHRVRGGPYATPSTVRDAFRRVEGP
ncbi:MGMT family protein [Halorubrum sp. DTA46]|uniref:MGMT family protein n=1 Tax=Halorubrum sp. DTA46 TaxID=3402162 RepID=UPI003AABC37C